MRALAVLSLIGLACADNGRDSAVKSDTLPDTAKVARASPAPDSLWKVERLAVAPDRFRPGAWSDETVLWGLVRGRVTKLDTQTGAVSTIPQTGWSFSPGRGVASWRNETGTWMVRDGGTAIRIAAPGIDSISGFDGPPTVLWSPDGSRGLLAWQGEGDFHYRLFERDGSTRNLRLATPGYYGHDAVLWLDSARVLFHIVANAPAGGEPTYRESGWHGALALLDLRTGAYTLVAKTRDSTALRVAGAYLDEVLVTEWGDQGVRGHWFYDPRTWERRAASLPRGRAFSSPAGVVVILRSPFADSVDAVLVTPSDTIELGRVPQDAQPAFSPSGRRGALRTSRGVLVFEAR